VNWDCDCLIYSTVSALSSLFRKEGGPGSLGGFVEGAVTATTGFEEDFGGFEDTDADTDEVFEFNFVEGTSFMGFEDVDEEGAFLTGFEGNGNVTFESF
jgi:hypothetical protein